MNDRMRSIRHDAPTSSEKEAVARFEPTPIPAKPIGKSRRRRFVKRIKSKWSKKTVDEDKISLLPTPMVNFFANVDSVKNDIEAMKAATQRIRDMNETTLLATTYDEESQLSKELQTLVQQTSERTKQTKDLLLSMRNNDDERAAHTDSELRMRGNVCNALTHKFIEETKLFQQAQEKYKADAKTKLTRQVHLICPAATDEDVEMVAKSKGGVEELYKRQVLDGGTVAVSVKDMSAQISEKYQEILFLERSINELHGMFCDLAILVEQQGPVLDHIEVQVKSAAEHVIEGNDSMEKSLDYQRRIRKKQMFIVLGVVIVIVIIVVLVL